MSQQHCIVMCECVCFAVYKGCIYLKHRVSCLLWQCDCHGCVSQATNEYKVEYLAYSKMSRHCIWTVTWYKLLDSIMPTKSCVPHTVSAVPLVIRAAGFQFWPPTRQRHKKATVATQFGVLGGGDGEEHDGWGSVAEPTYDLDEDQGIGEPGHGDECGLPPVDDGLLARAEAEYHLRAEEEASAELVPTPPGVPAEPEHAEPAPATPGAVAPATPGAVAPGTQGLEEPQVPQPRAFGSRTVPAATVELPGGRISFQSSTNSFQATCMNTGHGTCLMSRTSHVARKPTGLPNGQGRPVGFLATWLAHHSVGTKAEHWCKIAMQQYTHAERLEHRMKVLQQPAGRALCSFERERQPGENIEPETLKGLL
jgi:hypothetical protein